MIETIFPTLNITSCPQIWTSTSKRAKQTAATVLTTIQRDAPDFINNGANVKEDDFLTERYLGILLHLKKLKTETFSDNASKQVLESLMSAQHIAHELDPFAAFPMFGESPRLKKLFSQSTNAAIFKDIQMGQKAHWVFSHADEIKSRLHDFMNWDGHSQWRNLTIHNCDTFMLFHKNNGWQVQKIYDGKREKTVHGHAYKQNPETIKSYCKQYAL